MNKIPGTSSAAADPESALFASIRALILSARNTVARGVDLIQVRTNFEIGRHVVAHEQQGESRAKYGKEVLKRLAERLTAEFGRGFSVTNLKFMRQFYLLNAQRMGQTASDPFQIPKGRIGQTPSDLLPASEKRPFSLSWSHYVFLLGIKKADERDFYEIEAASQNWTLRELKRQFDQAGQSQASKRIHAGNLLKKWAFNARGMSVPSY